MQKYIFGFCWKQQRIPTDTSFFLQYNVKDVDIPSVRDINIYF